MRRFVRILGRVLLGIVGLVVLVMALVGGVLTLTVPSGREQADIAGLSAPVDIGIDGDGVPHIRAANAADAAAALGFVHARDRMFSMDMMRRAASGRLSEVIGRYGLRIDRAVRMLGLHRAAEAEWAAMPADARAVLEAYARGVNAWIAAHGRLSAPQFAILGTPAPWTPVDSLLWGQTMSLYLSGNWQGELNRTRLLGHASQATIDQLWPPQATTLPPSAGSGIRFAEIAPGLAGAIDAALPHFPDPFTLPSEASNEWAVDGAHSTTGAPLLAGDPHLGYSSPSLWYLARIDTPDAVLAGATAPGVPFLVLGRNSHIAWTFTTAGADTQDLFSETVLPDGRYQTPDGPADFTTRQETIHVLFQRDVVLTVRETRHGPVVSDLAGNGVTGPVYAAAMANVMPGAGAAYGLLKINQATTVAEAGQAAGLLTSVALNMLVADHAGISQFTTGRIPIRRAGDGEWPQEGADGAHDWVGWASGAALPHVIDPPSGRIVNTNERVAPPDFPVFMGHDWFGDWRAQRVRTLLGDTPRSAEDFAAMQVDAADTFAQTMLPRLASLPRGVDLAGRALTLLDHWDGTAAMDAPQPLIFNAWMRQFDADLMQRANLTDTTAPDLADFLTWVMGPGSAQAAWCGGDCLPLLDASLQHAMADLAQSYGPDPAAWRWGAAHIADFADPVLPFLSATIPQPGDDTTLFRGGSRRGSFDAVHGPGYRGVYDLANLDDSLFIIAPGQSSHPFSPHRTDMLLAWRNGGSVKLLARAARTDAVLRLQPP